MPIVIGLLGTLGGGQLIWYAWASRKWPSTKGTIISRRLNVGTQTEGNPTYHADIRYEYHVDGRRHESGKISYKAYGSTNPKGAVDTLEQHKTGAEVTVYYNPRNPKVAVLYPGIGPICFVMLPFSLLILGFGLFLLMKE